MSGNQASCSMRLLGKQLCRNLASLFLFRYISFAVALFFKSILQQRMTTGQNSCRERCSGVNWSSQLDSSAKGVAYNSARQVARGQF